MILQKPALNQRILCLLAAIMLLASLLPSPALAETFREALKRGQALEDEEDDEGAIAAYVLAKSMAPNPYNDARIGLARLYAKLGRYSEADSEYQAMLPSTKDKQLRYEYGHFLVNQGKFDSASSIWSDLLAIDPKDVTALYYMGQCLWATDSIDAAKEHFERVIEIAPGSAAAAKAKDKLGHFNNVGEMRKTAKSFPIDPDLGTTGFGWWDLAKMPIHVYIDEGDDVKGYRPIMRNYVFNALESWRAASGARIWFYVDPTDKKGEFDWRTKVANRDPDTLIEKNAEDLLADPIKTNIHVHWVPTLGRALGMAWTSAYDYKTTSAKKKKEKKKDEDEDEKKEESASELDKNSKESDKSKKAREKGEPGAINVTAHVWLTTNCLADGSQLPEQINAANAAVLERQDRCMAEVAIHEFGHVLGLPHTSNPKDIMFGGIFAHNSLDLVESRSLSNGDLRSLAEHYINFQGHGIPIEILGEDLAVAVVRDGHNPALLTTNSRKTERTALPPPVKAPPQDIKYKEVLFDLGTGKYASSLEKLDKLLLTEPKDATAHYLRAITQVNLRNYKAAEDDYKAVTRLLPGSALANKAAAGLKKIEK